MSKVARKLVLEFKDNGSVSSMWSEMIPLKSLGTIESAERASTIEFNVATQKWEVKIGGSPEVEFAHASRERCLHYEVDTLNEYL